MDKSVLKKALADSEEPTPGYLFRDIAKMTYVDSNTQDKLVAYLFEKLSVKNSVHVLSKTLNVIKHLCKEGHADFQKTMQRKSDDMKQFATYRGPADPKYGDKLNERVRTYAREAIDAAFSARRDTNVNIGQGTGGGSAPTNTSSSGGGVRAAISNAASSVSGFVTGQKTNEPASLSIPGSNERCAPMPTTNKWAEHMASQQTKNGGTGFGFMNNMKDKVNTGFGMWEQGVQSKEERMMAELNSGPGGFQAVEIPGQFNKQGGAAGGSKAMQANSGSGGFGGQNDGGGWKFTQESQGGGAPAGSQGGQQKKVQTVLEREVEKLATMKSTPKRVELSQFLTAVHAIIVEDSSSNYTYEDLASAMDAHLSGKNTWQCRLNTLSAVEYILRAEEPQPGAEFKEYFTENPEDIQRNVAVVQEALKEKAQKVLKILGVPDRLEVAKQQAEAKKQQQQIQQQQNKASAAATQQTNLDGTTNWSANMNIDTNNSTPAGGASTDDVSAGGGGFLEGMTVKSGGGGGAGAGGRGKEAGDKTKLKRRGPMSLEAFDNNNNQQQQQQQNSNNAFGSWGTNNNNDDGGWGSSSTAPSQQQQQQQQQAPAPKSAVSLDDIFGGTAPTTTSSSTSQQQQQQQPKASSAGSFDPFASAFGGEQAPKQQQQQQQQQQQTPSASISPAQSNVSVPSSSAATSTTPAPAPASSSSSAAVDAQKQQLAQQCQQQMMMLMQQSMAAAQRGDTQTAQTLMQQQQQLMAQMTAMMGGAQ